jgi:hypothetical protein
MTAAHGVLRDNGSAEVADIAAHFRPDEVPLIDHHWSSVPVGWVRAILPEGSDIWFVATVDDAGMADRLHRGPVGVSLEMEGRGVVPLPSERGHILPVILPTAYRGTIAERGWTLVGIACLRDDDPPGAPGSALWSAEWSR